METESRDKVKFETLQTPHGEKTSVNVPDSDKLTIEEFTQLLKDKKIEYEEGDPEEWFALLKKKGGTLTKEGIGKFTLNSWNRLLLPIGVEDVLKEWASPQAQIPQKQSSSLESSTLRFKNPESLLYTSGRDWKYQTDQKLMNQLKESLPLHYKNWKEGNQDKQCHPAYFLFAGPGTGKSRTLSEFQNLCCEVIKDNAELHECLSKAFVFKVTIKKGSGSFEIGNRMLFQLIGENIAYGSFTEKYNVTPAEVLDKLAEGEKIKPKDMAVFILVDGTHALPHQNGQTQSMMKEAIDSVVSLVNGGPYFCIGVFAATVYTPLEQTLANSPQNRVSLVPPVIDGHIIIESDDPLVRIFIDDMGGHGRALEALQETMNEIDISTFPASQFMNHVKSKMESKYPDLIKKATDLVPILAAVLTRQRLSLEDKIPGMDMKVEQLITLGLFRWKEETPVIGFLECPYVILWLLATWSQNPIVSHYKLDAYNEQQSQTNPSIPLGAQMWQNWEEMTAQFRVLKSMLLDGKEVQLSSLHAGALLGTDSSINVKVHKLNGFVRASHQYLTKKQGKRKEIIKHEGGTVDLTKENVFVINGTSASAGDGFCPLDIEGESPVREIHQNKHIKGNISIDQYMEEYKKAAQTRDLFILFTTRNTTVTAENLPSRGGIVSKAQMKDYFGPFAARAFCDIKVNINEASRAQLEAIAGIGHATADEIIESRKRKQIESWEDLEERGFKLSRNNSRVYIAKKVIKDEE